MVCVEGFWRRNLVVGRHQPEPVDLLTSLSGEEEKDEASFSGKGTDFVGDAPKVRLGQ